MICQLCDAGMTACSVGGTVGSSSERKVMGLLTTSG